VADHRSHQATIDALWDFDDPAASEHRFSAAADSASAADRDVLLTQVARARGLQGRFDEALALLESLDATQSEVAVRALLERGRALNSSGNPDAARPLFEQAFAAASAAGFEFLAVDALHMLAIVGASDAQDTLNRRALDLASSADDPRARQWRGSLLNNMGWTAFDRGDLDDSLRLFEDGVAARQHEGRQPAILVARWCVARCLREMGRTDEALAIQLSLADAHRAAGSLDPYVDEEIGLLQQKITPEPGST
jgi:tetratricopeptide (TPR) repeat protein